MPDQTLPEADLLTVPCNDCMAQSGTACHGDLGVHATRRYAAARQNLEHGTCALCGYWLVRGTINGGPVEVWHPDSKDADACPALPNPARDWNAYALALQAGARVGYPGPENFIP